MASLQPSANHDTSADTALPPSGVPKESIHLDAAPASLPNVSLSSNVTPNTLIQPTSYRINDVGHACLGGVDLIDLAQTYGTPLYVLDQATFEAMAKVYTETLAGSYSGQTLVIYAGKANLTMGMCRLAQQCGLGLDVVSGGELYTALQAGFPVEKIFFNGNNKSLDEVTLAVHNEVGRITVDNFYELELIHQAAQQQGKVVNVLLRVTPGIDCHTHDYIRTGQTDTKFGFDLAYLSQAVDRIQTEYRDTIKLRGLHAHIGSQIFEVQPYIDLARVLLNIYFNIRETYDGLELSDLNLGGGMGIAYTGKDDPPSVDQAYRQVMREVQLYAEKINYPLPRVVIEPGRSMVATSGVTLYKIGSFKQVHGGRKYVTIDGGMGDNIRPSLYQAKYSAIIANKANQHPLEGVTIAGKFCESGDILIDNLPVPDIVPGDTLLVFGTGAYNYSMSSNYNRIPRPAMVLVNNGQHGLLVRRETYADLIQYDQMPQHLIHAPA
jgi:diaminopimelate decarboxylase